MPPLSFGPDGKKEVVTLGAKYKFEEVQLRGTVVTNEHEQRYTELRN